MTGSVTRLALRRRASAEQRAIRMIRGGDAGDGDAMPVHAVQFGRLRALAIKNGLAVQPPASPFVSGDELSLLAWLAQAQRVAGYGEIFHPDAALTLTIAHCAGTLDAIGIRLPPLALLAK
ncbi:MAG: hypothetical protein QM690_15305 [Sphingobium sp.]